jgi:hypothetical protein
MQAVYGRKLAANAGVRETWMDRFTQLEPEGGFRAVVGRVWRRGAPTLNRTGPVNSLNGRAKPVYGRRALAVDARLRETWMGRFTLLEPEGGFRAVVERTRKLSTARSDQQLTTLAA